MFLACKYCLTMTFLRRVSPVVFNCLHPKTSHPSEKLASNLTPWGMIKNISRSTLQRSVYFECISYVCSQWSVISGHHNVVLISIRSVL
jgi:hypothetical protein